MGLDLGKWFEKSRELTMNAPQVASQWRTARRGLAMLPQPMPDPAVALLNHGTKPHVDVVATLRFLGVGVGFKEWSCNPRRSEDEVSARKFDLLVLAFMGVLVVVQGRFKVIKYDDNDEDAVRALTLLQLWDPNARLQSVQSAWDSASTTTTTVTKCDMNQDEADQLVIALKKLLDGAAATVEQLPCPVKMVDLPAELPTSQIETTQKPVCPPQCALSTSGSSSTQTMDDDIIEDTPDDNGPKPKRLRQEAELRPQDWQVHRALMSQIVAYMLTNAKDTNRERRRLKIKFGADAKPETLDQLITCAYRVLETLQLAVRSDRGSSITVYAPPVESQIAVATALKDLLGLTEKDATSLRTVLPQRDVAPAWDAEAFLTSVAWFGDTLKTP